VLLLLVLLLLQVALTDGAISLSLNGSFDSNRTINATITTPDATSLR
jgi:hypothetical protein